MATIRLGSQIICPVKVYTYPEVGTLTVIPSLTAQTFLDNYNKIIVKATPSNIDVNIKGENIKNGVTILGVTGNADPMPQYYISKTIDSDGKLTNKTTEKIQLKGIRILHKLSLAYAYYGNTNFEGNLVFYDVDKIESKALLYAFANTHITNISFPSLTTDSFGTATDQFNNMLNGCSNVTVHFPMSIQSTIENWDDLQANFGGTNITISFDL